MNLEQRFLDAARKLGAAHAIFVDVPDNSFRPWHKCSCGVLDCSAGQKCLACGVYNNMASSASATGAYSKMLVFQTQNPIKSVSDWRGREKVLQTHEELSQLLAFEFASILDAYQRREAVAGKPPFGTTITVSHAVNTKISISGQKRMTVTGVILVGRKRSIKIG